MDLLSGLEPFAGPIGDAARIYPAIAVPVTFPLAVLHYRRWGRIHPWRAAALYSFAFYLVASLFLILLPLPDLPARGANLTAWDARFGRLRTPELDPTASVREAFTGTVRPRALFQVLFNLVLLAPLGVYLRWLFGRLPSTAALIGFLVSLAFETCQLTGIFWIYPGPFRLFDTGDLMLNTLGCLAGAAVTSPLVLRKKIPDLSVPPRPAGQWIGVVRRGLAWGIDFFTFGLSVLFFVEVMDLLGLHSKASLYLGPAVMFLLLFVALPAATEGRGLGKRLMLCTIADRNGGMADRWRIVVRQGVLWTVPALIWLSSGWLPGKALGPTPLGWAVAAWCVAWAINAASAVPSIERASVLDRALRLRVTNTWQASCGHSSSTCPPPGSICSKGAPEAEGIEPPSEESRSLVAGGAS